MIKLLDILNESYNPNIYQINCKIVISAGNRNISDIISDIRAIPGITIVDTIDSDYNTEEGRHTSELSLKIDPSPFNPFNSESYDEILSSIKKLPDVRGAKYTSNPISINENKLHKLIKEVLQEKEDRCKRIADRKYDKPSAYKSGAIVRCRKGDIWKDLKESNENSQIDTINNIFDSNPELANIGTPEQYTKYLKTIFPNSKVKDIVYHGGTLNPNDRGKDSFTGELGGKHGIYFTGSKSRAKSYIRGGGSSYKSKSKIYFALLNIERPLDKKIWSKWKFGADTITDEGLKQMKENNSDGIIVTDLLSRYTNIKYTTQYVVLEMKQIYILGSDKDIDGFKKYVNVLTEVKKETLRTWFKRKGAPGKEGGWVDCNTCRDGKCKSCGRKKGEKRAKYPSCRPTPAKCKTKGKGKKWGKTK